MSFLTKHYPFKVNIGCYVYTVDCMKDQFSRDEVKGACHHSTKQIILDDTLPNFEILDTLMHELAHASINTYSKVPDKDDIEEAYCYSLGHGMLDIFTRNRHLLIMIQEGDFS